MLPKKYIKLYGISKRAWREYNKTKKGNPKKRKAGGKTMAKKKSSRRSRGKLFTKTMVDGLLSAGGKVVVRKLIGGNQLIDASIDLGLGFFRNNKTLLGQGIIEGITIVIPSLNMNNSSTGGFGFYES